MKGITYDIGYLGVIKNMSKRSNNSTSRLFEDFENLSDNFYFSSENEPTILDYKITRNTSLTLRYSSVFTMQFITRFRRSPEGKLILRKIRKICGHGRNLSNLLQK